MLPQVSKRIRRDLKVWCVMNDLSLGDIAKHAGVSRALLSLWLSGRRRIAFAQAQEIAELTAGTVNPEDWPWMWLEGEGREVKHAGAGRASGA